MIQAKPKKCKACKTPYQPYSSLSQACSPKCALELVSIAKNKKHKKEKLEYRIKTKSISAWIKDAQFEVNAYVRLRDHHLNCISCDRSPEDTHLRGSAFHAGHYRGRGASPNLRFNLHNIRKQCAYCNEHLSGNVVEYRKGLIKRIGVDKVEAIEVNNSYKKFDRHYCERIKKIFNKKARLQKKRLGID